MQQNRPNRIVQVQVQVEVKAKVHVPERVLDWNTSFATVLHAPRGAPKRMKIGFADAHFGEGMV